MTRFLHKGSQPHPLLLLLVLVRCFLPSSSADALDDWHWRSPRWTAAPMSSVAFGGGRYVAVGNQGGLVVSEDGAHWYTVESPTRGNLRAAAWAEGQWVVVGDYGEVVTSVDGIRWTRESAPVFHHLRSVTRGNGLWVAVGDNSVILTSPDGRTWTQRASGSEPLRSVTWAKGVFVAGGGAEGKRNSQGYFIETHPALVLTSRDGLLWTSVPQRASGPVVSIVSGAGRFVAVTTTGNALISEDGDRWTSVSLDLLGWYQPDFLAIAHDGTRFVISQSARFGTLERFWTSPDGISWSPLQVSGLNYAYNYTGLAFGQSGWVAVGGLADPRYAFGLMEGNIAKSRDGQEWVSVDSGPKEWLGQRDQLAFAGGRFFRSSASSNDFSQAEQTVFEVSSTGRQWERRRVSFDAHFSLPAFGLGRFVCVGRDGRMLVSEDANQWKPTASGVTNMLNCVVFSESEGQFVVGGEGGTVLVSADGLAWESLQVPTTNTVVMVAASQGRILVGCSGSTYSQAPFVQAETLYVRSGTGIWSGPIQDTPAWIEGLGSWEEGFYAVANGRLVHSPNGTQWTTDVLMNSGATVPTSGGGRLLVFRLGSTSFFERRAGEAAWRTHELPWKVREGPTTYYAPITAAYGHGTFLLTHGSRSLIQSEPLEPVAPLPDPAPAPAISEGIGSTVTLEAITRGSEPMRYQWRRDGVDLPGATTPYLHLPHADGPGVAYTCWVTNALGGAVIGPFQVVTAAPAQLELSSNGMGVRVWGTPRARYRLEASGDLQSWWTFRDLELTSEGDDSAKTGLESPSTSNTRLFFRARPLP